MSDIRITEVEALYFRMPEIKDRTDSSQDALVVRISTDQGVVGYGEVDANPLVVQAIVNAPTSHLMSRGLRDVLIGEDPLEITRLRDKMYQATLYYGRNGAVIQAMAGIDLALWDIKGKLLEQPVYKLLGGGEFESIRAYASHMFAFTPEETQARATRAAADGFHAVKFGWEPLGPDPEFDRQLVAAVRNGVGSGVDVMIDAGLAWDAKSAIQRCRLFEPYNLFWLEEPLHPDNLRGYRRLSETVGMRIAAGEQECTAAGFQQLMDIGSVDVVQIDVTRVGLTEAVRIARMAHERGLPVANHNFTTDINTAASLHFLACAPNALILEYCVEENPLRRNIVRNPVKVVDGHAYLPQEPGLGVDVDIEAVSQYLVRSA
ncbi:mandelate racemase/muconate lactonizing enzyme family protein [Dactylosporangium sp. NPDC050688]|uniref:mandelate racemase/muconate lactonizing enzyme family protein n=1 Tax=Dactylosporangium sp. NPDC050688 TaxID=3157217 RepID=UPI0033CA5442